ncbi:MAG: SulP family inorganic anion transporter [Microbacterium sp.]
MSAVVPSRYRIEPTVWQAVRTPRLLTREVLAGLVTALALIPEAIAFTVVAGVDPRVGLFASFVLAVVIAFTGGRPAMITAAAGSVALVIAPVSREHGPDYLIATIVLAGVFQVLLAACGAARLMRFVPRSVMVGFVNALAILIFVSQLPQLIDVPWPVYALTAAGLVVLLAWPRITRAVPAPLVAIVLLTAAVIVFGITVPDVAAQGTLPDSLPGLLIPDVPLTWDTLQIIAFPALAAALVGLLETLMTAKLVDEITDTHSRKTREAWGLGVANIAAAFFGGTGGCAMIGQTMINVKTAGGRTRISTFLAGVWLLVLVVLLGDLVGRIPMAALVAVMILVSVTTFDWHSVRPSTLRRMPLGETLVMLVTVAVTVWTDNLAIGVGVGVVTAMTIFARRVAHLTTLTRVVDGDVARYTVDGELFFASSNDLTTQFDYAADPRRVVIDLSRSHVWDASSVAALDAITTKYAARGTTVEVVGLNPAAAAFHARLSGRLGAGH